MPTGQQYSSTAAQEQLVGGITNSSLTCTVTGTTGFPANPFTIIFDIGTATQEACDVTNVAGDVLTITRGVDGTSAQSHSNGATVTHAAIARDFREARAHMDASGTGGGTTVHGLQSGSVVVGTTDTQTLTNKTFTSPTFVDPTISSADITGTVAGGATYTAITATSPTISGTVGGGASYTAPTLTSPVITGTVSGTATYDSPTMTNTSTTVPPLEVNGIASTTAALQQWNLNGTEVAWIGSTGGFNGPTISPTGLTGAVSASRYVGATAGGPPTSGTFSTGDWVEDTTYGIMWACVSGGTPGTWVQSGNAVISHQVLGSNASTINFSSIPTYFRHLLLITSAQSNGTLSADYNQVNITWNGVATSNYNFIVLSGSIGSASATVGYQTSSAFAQIGDVWNAHAASAGTGRIETLFPNYSESTFNKNLVSSSYASDGGGIGRQGHFSAAFLSAATAITSLALTNSDASSFVTGSQFELIGIG